MRSLILAFAAGVLWLQWQPELPSVPGWTWPIVLVTGVAGLVVDAGAWARRAGSMGRVVRSLLGLLLALLCGIAWAAACAHWRLADALDPALEGRDLDVAGVVASLPQPIDRGVRFEFDVEEGPPGLPQRVQLAWYNGLTPDGAADALPALPVRAGERWRFRVRLRLPHGSANAHGFDYEAWLLERGIRATGYVRPGPRARLDAFVARPSYVVERLREAVRLRFREVLGEAPYAGVLLALAIGDQRAIPAAQWEVFARTGISHLMSISGLHVTMVSGLFALLVLTLWRRVPMLALRLPAQKAAAPAGALAALAYCAISGFAVPAQRTLYMVSVVAVLLCLNRFTSASRVLALALLAVLLMDPWAVLAPGFWLSFGAVAVIFYVALDSRRPVPDAAEPGWPQRLLAQVRQWGRVQWAVTVGLAPALLALFGQVSLASPLANAVAIPVVSFVVTPLVLLAALLPVDALLHVAHAVTGVLMQGLNWLAARDAAIWQQHAPPVWTLLPALIGTLWLLAPRGVPARVLGLVAMLPIFFVAPLRPAPGEFSLTVLDVGQGLAVAVRTSHHDLLYDTGPAWNEQADSGNRVILPWLRGEGVNMLDLLVLSHQDRDHTGGARSVLAGVPVHGVAASMTFDEVPEAVTWRIPCVAGRSWEWDGVRFSWLNPPAAPPPEMRSGNDRSCVLRVDAPGGAALIAGDIEKAAEQWLLRREMPLRADVLVVPHHGSGTSSTAPFLAAVAPVHAAFSVGYRNRFGHPQAAVWERHADSERVRTDRDGAIRYHFGKEGIVRTLHREVARRYWDGR